MSSNDKTFYSKDSGFKRGDLLILKLIREGHGPTPWPNQGIQFPTSLKTFYRKYYDKVPIMYLGYQWLNNNWYSDASFMSVKHFFLCIDKIETIVCSATERTIVGSEEPPDLKALSWKPFDITPWFEHFKS